jgi:uncharacterized protein
MPRAAPIAEGLFTWPSGAQSPEGATAEPRLIGSACRQCGTTTFPKQASCPRCTGVDVEERLLERSGTLWSYTVQGFEPKEPYRGPVPFEPYGVGYVELAGQVIVESLLTESDPEKLEIGERMDLVLIPFRVEDDGTEVFTFAFRPAAGEGEQ